ncbi:MAG: YdeI/OmpD-associated family protein [Planctomycetota bacterium]
MRATTVDEYLEQHGEWRTALRKLRRLLRATELEETVKWGAPCYTLDGKNVVGLGAFQGYVGLWFHQGAFLRDKLGVLVNAQKGKTRGMRQWRFDRAAAIEPKQVSAYLQEAIDNQRAGKAIKPQRGGPLQMPAELEQALAKRKRAKTAFAALTPGKQREYADHVASAKLDKTKTSRVAKILPMIEAGVGLHDRYRNC